MLAVLAYFALGGLVVGMFCLPALVIYLLRGRG
jgi:hypothetical protein